MGTAGRRCKSLKLCHGKAANLFSFCALLIVLVAFAGCALSPTGYTGDPGTVKTPSLRTINLKPNSSSTGVGEELQFTATGKYSDGSTKDLTESVAWGSSNTNEVTIETAGQSNPGLAMGMAPGRVSITASISGLTATGNLTINVVGPSPTQAALTSMILTPGSVTLGMPSMQQFIATGTFSDGSVGDLTDNAMWTSSNPAVVFIESGSQDNPGFAVAMSPGTATITASMSGLTQSLAFTVTAFRNALPQAGGITAIPPGQTLGNNQVSNTGFETGSSGWNLPSCFLIDSTVGHTGTHSLRYNASTSCGTPADASTLVTRGPGAARSYTIQGWVQGTQGTDAQVKLAIHDQTQGGLVIGETNYITPGTSWELIQQTNIDLLPLHDGDTLSVQAIGQGSRGEVWFDDIQLIEQLPPPVSSFLLYPNYQGQLWGNGPQTIRMEVEVPNPSGMTVVETLEDTNSNVIQTITQPAAALQEIDFNSSALATGTYLVETTLTNSSAETVATYPAYRVIKTDPTYQTTLLNYIDTDNFLVSNGQKEFVWGVYDRWSSNRCTTCVFTNENGYLTIPGFNGLSTIGSYQDTMQNAVMGILPFAGVNVEPSNNQLIPWLQAVNSVGVGQLQIVNNWVEGAHGFPSWATGMDNQALWQMATQSMNNQHGSLGFYTYDEPDPFMIPTAYYQHVSLLTPGEVGFGTLSSVQPVFRWRDMNDVLSCDPYPVGQVPDADEAAEGATLSPPMMRTSMWTRDTVSQVYGSRPVWMVLQLFDLNGDFPTYAQMKIQAYKAIINGANGILWWGFVSEKGIEWEWYVELNQQPYFDFKQISGEVMGLKQFLILPPQQQLLSSVSSPKIEYLVKNNGTQIVIFASNFSDQPIGNITFTLAPGTSVANVPVTVYSENRTVPLNGGNSFTDNFNGYDVHVYTLNLQ
jgi:hypothetical protein